MVYVKWGQADHYSAPLYGFMRQATIGRARDQSVYIVRNAQQVIYVGKTTQGVYDRLWKHVNDGSRLGVWLIDHEFDETTDPYEIEVITVVFSLDAAEQYLITTLTPILNVVRYREALTAPPVFICPKSQINLSHFPVYRYSQFEHIPYFQEKEDLIDLEACYARAYRDPNHPDLRVRSASGMDVFYYQRTKNIEVL